MPAPGRDTPAFVRGHPLCPYCCRASPRTASNSAAKGRAGWPAAKKPASAADDERYSRHVAARSLNFSLGRCHTVGRKDRFRPPISSPSLARADRPTDRLAGPAVRRCLLRGRVFCDHWRAREAAHSLSLLRGGGWVEGSRRRADALAPQSSTLQAFRRSREPAGGRRRRHTHTPFGGRQLEGGTCCASQCTHRLCTLRIAAWKAGASVEMSPEASGFPNVSPRARGRTDGPSVACHLAARSTHVSRPAVKVIQNIDRRCA